MSRYGISSRRMLSFLNENPGATSGEIKAHLSGDKTVTQLKVRYKTVHWRSETLTHTQWQSKRYVLEQMMKSKYYWDIEILDERERPLSKIQTGKYAYLLSPYYSRTLSADVRGSRPHPSSVNRSGQRMWFFRWKEDGGKYRYFLTIKGMTALKRWGME